MKTTLKIYLLASLLVLPLLATSCYDDLNTIPEDPDIVTAAAVFDNDSAYIQFLAKIYAGLSVTGNQGPSGSADISGIDEGSQASYLRMLWNMQELPTEEGVCSWNDQTIKNFHGLSWTSTDVFIKGFYYRLYYQITLACEFLRETTDAKLNDRGVTDALKAEIKNYRAEARFLRALSYYHVLDHFRQGPYVDESTAIGSIPPEMGTAQQIYDFIETELTAIDADLLDPWTGFDVNNYGRANKAAAKFLLAKLYLNAETYVGTAKYTECITACKDIIGYSTYSLEPVYADLFKADNNTSPEIIFPMVFDATNLQTWGGMMFLMCAAVNADLQAQIAAPGGWAGNRATDKILDRFTGVEAVDERYAVLYTGYNLTDMTSVDEFKEGVQVLKYSNKNSDGTDSGGSFPNTDFPLFRFADVYLMFAEAVLRGGAGGSTTDALTYVNNVIDRAYLVDAIGEKTAWGDVTEEFLLEERGREFLWEAQRRTDLVRFGKLTSATYLWDFKGGVQVGKGVDSFRDVYPLPADDVNANPNLEQNEGYN
jgi:starch-binding outer membrane protein, SusD/RagB family